MRGSQLVCGLFCDQYMAVVLERWRSGHLAGSDMIMSDGLIGCLKVKADSAPCLTTG